MALASAAVSLVALAGCSGDPRISDGERFSEAVVGEPGVVLIDDMEDGTQYILSDDGRVGLWYTYNDESIGSSQEPALGFPMYRTTKEDGSPEPSSQVTPRPCGGVGTTPFFAGEDSCKFVARTWGTGQRGWGAGMGVDINGEGGIKNPFDAGDYGGIGFFATGDVRANTLRMNIQDVRTTPESAAAADRRGIPRCESYATNASGVTEPTGRCNDHYGYTVQLSSEWRWYEIPFACMQSGAWGYPGVGGENAPLPSGIVGVQFQVQGADPADSGTLPPGATIEPFDFSIDNLSFIEKSRLQDPPMCP